MRVLLLSLLAALLISILLGGCASENLEDLSGQSVDFCDTTAVATYSAVIRPVLERNLCLSCHVPGGDDEAVRNFDYSTPAGLEAAARAGKLIRAIEHTGPYQMPKNAPKMSDCDIARIKQWIRLGYPTN